MTLEKLQSEMIQAMKNKDKFRKSVLSGLVDTVKKASMTNKGRVEITEQLVKLGAGLGLQWLEGRSFDGLGTWSFNQELGASWVKERYESAFTDDYAAFRYAHHLAWDPGWLDGFKFTHNFEYLPDTADWADNYIIDSDFGFTYAFKANWQLLGKIEWDYKSQVAEGTKHSDLRYTLGLGYKW